MRLDSLCFSLFFSSLLALEDSLQLGEVMNAVDGKTYVFVLIDSGAFGNVCPKTCGGAHVFCV
jgi:hypothetical protein